MQKLRKKKREALPFEEKKKQNAKILFFSALFLYCRFKNIDKMNNNLALWTFHFSIDEVRTPKHLFKQNTKHTTYCWKKKTGIDFDCSFSFSLFINLLTICSGASTIYLMRSWSCLFNHLHILKQRSSSRRRKKLHEYRLEPNLKMFFFLSLVFCQLFS